MEFADPGDPDHRIRADLTWLTSAWTCIYGRGCAGVVEGRPDDGCCSHGAFFTEEDDLARVTANVDLLTDDDWQLAPVGRGSWTEQDGADDAEPGVRSMRTRTVDGACVFLNRPGHPGGMGWSESGVPQCSQNRLDSGLSCPHSRQRLTARQCRWRAIRREVRALTREPCPIYCSRPHGDGGQAWR